MPGRSKLAERADALARVMELASRQIHARGHSQGLYPAQWSAIRYFRAATGEHRTAIALARYQGLAFGAVAQTVRTLIARGLLRKAGSAGRGRTQIIEVTPEGLRLLSLDPLASIASAIARLAPERQDALAEALDALLREFAARVRPSSTN